LPTPKKVVIEGNAQALRALLDKGVDPSLSNVDGLTPLHQVGLSHASHSLPLALYLPLTTTANPESDQPPQACIDNRDDLALALLQAGALVDQMDNEDWTPLHAAASMGSLACARCERPPWQGSLTLA
jgi:ankyrin repeat protein